jgi:hypothetical protein
MRPVFPGGERMAAIRSSLSLVRYANKKWIPQEAKPMDCLNVQRRLKVEK